MLYIDDIGIVKSNRITVLKLQKFPLILLQKNIPYTGILISEERT